MSKEVRVEVARKGGRVKTKKGFATLSRKQHLELSSKGGKTSTSTNKEIRWNASHYSHRPGSVDIMTFPLDVCLVYNTCAV